MFDNYKRTEMETFDESDVQQNKLIAALSYLIFFLPFIFCKDSKFARFHANQGLLLLLFNIVCQIALTVVPFLGGLVSVLLSIMCIYGMVIALQGQAKEFPVIGVYRLFK